MVWKLRPMIKKHWAASWKIGFLLNQFSEFINQHSWISQGFLILLAIAYCLPALLAPFWVGNDAWSNLLPIVHFRNSILNNHSLPLYTDLWYGGRFQWANPLWSFFYIPSTLIQLIAPLDWGTRIVYLGHLIIILLVGRKLASLFFNNEIERIASAIIVTSPILPAFTAGQNEKIMSWGWVLLALYLLLNEKLSPSRRGFRAGICLGIIPLTGSNYYVLYLGILLLLLALSYKNNKIPVFLMFGALIGLIHAPSVLHLIGQQRGNAEDSIKALSLSFTGIITSLSIGLAKPMGWETWAPIGIPMVYLFLKSMAFKTKSLLTQKQVMFTMQQKALILTISLFTLLATGMAYQGHHFLNLFRAPSRALPFIAIGVVLFNFIEISTKTNLNFRSIYLIASAFQVGVLSFMIQPYGARYSPYDPQAQNAADILKADKANSVWISMRELNDMYIQAVFAQNGLSLPNVYYGDMGQTVKIDGNYCGYSFDHLVTPPPVETQFIEITADMEWSNTKGKIPLSNLILIQQAQINGISYNFYRVVCNN